MPKPILIDVDGVLADLCSVICDFVNTKNNTSFTNDDLYTDFRIALGKYFDTDVDAFIRSDGFGQMLPLTTNAQELIDACRSVSNVVFVTSPYGTSKTWCYDRIKWLEKHFNVTRDDIIFARTKKYVDGLILIDDLPKNCKEWSEYNSKSSILVDAPWNKKDKEEGLVMRLSLDKIPYVISKLKEHL